MAAVTDPYATAPEYRARTGQSGTDDDTSITAVLTAVSRQMEKVTGQHFTVDAAAVARVYDGSEAVARTVNAEDLGLFARASPLTSDGTRLYIDNLSAAPTSVKVDLNGDYDFADSNETLTEGTHFWCGPANETLTEGTHFWCGPANADKGPEPRPYRYLDIVPGNGRLSRWPDQARSVEVTGKFGWPAVPAAIKEATIMIAHEMRDLEKSGFTLSLNNIDRAVNLSPAAFSIVQDIKREYGRKVPFV